MTDVVINIYDTQGKLVDQINNLSPKVGDYHVTWEERGRFAAGCYFYQIRANLLASSENHEVRGKLLKLK